MHRILGTLFGKKCAVCGKGGANIAGSGGKMFCCEKDKKFCEAQEKKGKPIAKGKVCEYC